MCSGGWVAGKAAHKDRKLGEEALARGPGRGRQSRKKRGAGGGPRKDRPEGGDATGEKGMGTQPKVGRKREVNQGRGEGGEEEGAGKGVGEGRREDVRKGGRGGDAPG